MRRLFVLAFVVLSISPLLAAVQLASPFGDHMVLQHGKPVPVWGTAAAGEKVAVAFAGQTLVVIASADGRWRVDLKPLHVAATGAELTVTGSATPAPLVLHDVLVGEVWICGGQSNMERQLGPRPGQKPIVNWEAEVAAATHPLFRQLDVKQTRAVTPQTKVDASWSVCSPATAVDFTAVGYFFGRDLLVARGVPVGIIYASWGGTPAEAWTSREGLAGFPEFADAFDLIAKQAADPAGAARDYAAQLSKWYVANDPGTGEHPWSDPATETTGWETMNLPVQWEQAGHPGFDGVVWFRRSFDLPAGWAGRELELRLGSIDDADTAWVNGVQVGATNNWIASRVYRVPASALQAKDNVIAVRVLDTGGNGGIWNEHLPLQIAPAAGGGEPLSLRGAWQCKFARSLEGTTALPINPDQGANAPAVLFNGMIAPLVPYAMRGVIFYQGEANAGRATQYRTLFPALITDWRRLWGEDEFPFLFVQIAPFKEQPPEIREAQFIAWQHTTNTAMAVTIDVGDADDIHPANKGPVGARLALAARALAYGEHVDYSGPAFERAVFGGGKAVLHFTHADGGLVAPGGTLEGFVVIAPDGSEHPARAEIVGEAVVVAAADGAPPAAVRYAWANVARGNLFNRAGLPASPFRTDVK
jgi:sialate O-acetylesterase